MKYICLLLLLVFMRWTWALSHTESAFSFEQQQELQGQVERMISDRIASDRTDIKGVYFQQMYLEIVHPFTEVKAHFRYRIEQAVANDSTLETFEGIATLRSKDEGRNWVVDHQTVRSPHLEFHKGLNVNLRTASPEEEVAEPAPTPEAPKAPTKSGH